MLAMLQKEQFYEASYAFWWFFIAQWHALNSAAKWVDWFCAGLRVFFLPKIQVKSRDWFIFKFGG